MDLSGKDKTCIVTGSQGFIGTYICAELLSRGYRVVGFDDYSKYGIVARPHDNHENFRLVVRDLSKSVPDFAYWKPDYVILGAAKIGGISYFHKYAFDLVRDNERILANCYDAIFESRRKNDYYDVDVGSPHPGVDYHFPERVVTISSSMVYEGADVEFDKLESINMYTGCCYPARPEDVWPSKEESVGQIPPPISTYGAQKLMCEYWARGAWEQYKLPYTIVRPFNAVGCYEGKALGESDVMSGNIALQLSHVLPDLINKCLKGQNPLHILGDGSQIRCYTNGKDIAKGIVAAMESPKGHNETFNISTPRATTVKELAEIVYGIIHPGKAMAVVSDPPFEHDVQKRIPDVKKAKALLGFEATISLEESVAEVIQWMKENER